MFQFLYAHDMFHFFITRLLNHIYPFVSIIRFVNNVFLFPPE